MVILKKGSLYPHYSHFINISIKKSFSDFSWFIEMQYGLDFKKHLLKIAGKNTVGELKSVFNEVGEFRCPIIKPGLIVNSHIQKAICLYRLSIFFAIIFYLEILSCTKRKKTTGK